MKKANTCTLCESVRIGSYSDPHYPVFGLNTERFEYGEMHSKYGKMGARITPNTDTFYAVLV